MRNFIVLIAFIKLLYNNRRMVFLMSIRNLKKRYIGSAFGLTWTVIEPLIMILIYALVFGKLFNARPVATYPTDSYVIYLMCGLIPWQFFSETITQSAEVIQSNKALVTRSVSFPSEIFQITLLISNMISHLIGMVIIVLIVFFFTPCLSLHAFYLFVYMFFGSLFVTGIGWFISSLNVYLKDIKQMIGLVMRAWLFYTPILYSTDLIPEQFHLLWMANPFYHIVMGYRHAILGGMFIPMPHFFYLMIISVVTFGVGGITFNRLKSGFGEVI